MAFMPFGAGRRQCVGMRLAYVEMKLVVANIFRRYTLHVCDKTQASAILRCLPLQRCGPFRHRRALSHDTTLTSRTRGHWLGARNAC